VIYPALLFFSFTGFKRIFGAPSLTFRALYCFFVIEHGWRKTLHFDVTDHPTGPWIVQQLRDKYVILDRDAKFGTEVVERLKASGIKLKRASPSSPWQNGISDPGSEAAAERFSNM
jgi:hypothetical protein